MSILTHSPAIVRDGLVLCLDAGAVRSYPEVPLPAQGPELVDNGSFTSGDTLWAKETGWTIVDQGSGDYEGVATSCANNIALWQEDTSIVEGATYRCTFTVTNRSAGAFQISVGNTNKGTTRSAVGTYTQDLVADSVQRMKIWCSGTTTGRVDDISIKRVYWGDLSGNFNDGGFINSPTFSAESGAGGTKSFDFDGSSDYVSLDTSAYAAIEVAAITVSAWIKRDADSGVYDGIVSTHVNTAEGFALLISGAHDTLFWQYDGSGSQINPGGGIELELGEWYHVVGTYDGAALKTYVNGVLDQTSSVTGKSLAGTDLPIFVGAQRSGLGVMGAPFNGKIAIVHMYNRALTAAEIQQNYRTHKGRFGK